MYSLLCILAIFTSTLTLNAAPSKPRDWVALNLDNNAKLKDFFGGASAVLSVKPGEHETELDIAKASRPTVMVYRFALQDKAPVTAAEWRKAVYMRQGPKPFKLDEKADGKRYYFEFSQSQEKGPDNRTVFLGLIDGKNILLFTFDGDSSHNAVNFPAVRELLATMTVEKFHEYLKKTEDLVKAAESKAGKS